MPTASVEAMEQRLHNALADARTATPSERPTLATAPLEIIRYLCGRRDIGGRVDITLVSMGPATDREAARHCKVINLERREYDSRGKLIVAHDSDGNPIETTRMSVTQETLDVTWRWLSYQESNPDVFGPYGIVRDHGELIKKLDHLSKL